MKTKLHSSFFTLQSSLGLLAAAGLVLFIASSVSVQAAIVPVTSTADRGLGSLRAALAVADNGDTIDATGVAGTITLATGALAVPNSVTILGPGPAVLTVNGNSASNVFNVSGTNVTISGLTITNGSSPSGAGVNAAGAPGSILVIDNCVIVSNRTTSAQFAGGGAIFNSPGVTMTVSNCTVSLNTAVDGDGGGIFNEGTLTVVNSTFSGNHGSVGGGIINLGTDPGNAILMVKTSTLSGNSADQGGGGICNLAFSGNATLTVSASTFSGNSAGGNGGSAILSTIGISGTAMVKINACTLSGNSGIGICAAGMEIGDTILKAGASGTNIYAGWVQSDGYNLSSDSEGGFLTNTTDRVDTDPLLGPLQDNGGPTWTQALLPGSPAIDQGKRDAVPDLALNTDQRGLARPVDFANVTNAAGGDGSDIGAFEVQVQSLFICTTNNGKITITGYTGAGGDVTIPDTISGLPVTSLGNYAFEHCNSLTNVTIPGSVASIGDLAFAGCTNLTGIYFTGNAPSLGGLAVFGLDANATVYCLPGTTGLEPQVQTSGADFGVRTNRFGFTVAGASGLGVVVQACTNLANPTWSPVATLSFTSDSVYFSDPQWMNYPARFYCLSNPTFGDLPVVLWNARVRTGDASLGVHSNRFGFTITGTAGIPIVVEACTNLASATWTPLQTCTVTNGSLYFCDPGWTNYAKRFYHIRWP